MNTQEILRFLGIYERNAEIEKLIEIQWNEIDTASAKRHKIVPFSVLEPPFPLEGEDIKRHLEGCQSGYLFVATLGSNIDTILKCKQLTSMRDAAIFDAAASSYLESYCDSVCEKLSEKQNITMRFSPGYGDFPLSLQPALLKAAGADKIGLSALPSLMMVPAKSVSAIIGIKE